MKSDGGHRTIALHADDFGMNESVNAGIVAGFRRGLLTGTSILANAPAAEAGADAWRNLERDRASECLASTDLRRRLAEPERPFDLGLHLNLTQGMPLSEDYPHALRNADGTFCGVWKAALALARAGGRHRRAIEQELTAQVARVRELGLAINRVDGHQYVEMLPVVAAALRELLPQCGIRHVRIAHESGLARTTLGEGRPVAWTLALVKRGFARRYANEARQCGFAAPEHFFGTAHAGRITLKKLMQFVDATSAGETAEIGLHPADATNDRPDSNDPWFDPLSRLRPRELAMIVDTGLAEQLAEHGVRLGRVAAAGAMP